MPIVTSVGERISAWLRRFVSRAETDANRGGTVTVAPSGSVESSLDFGDRDRETSTNAQTAGAADEPWSGNT